MIDEGSGATLLKTTLAHESGQWITSCARVVAGKTDRHTGNIYEVYKRLHALMLLGIAPSDNDPIAFDDNGDMMADEKLIAELRKPDLPLKPELDYNDVINKHQYDELLIELDGYPSIVKDMLRVYDIQTLADMPASEYHKARAKIRDIKKTHQDSIRKH